MGQPRLLFISYAHQDEEWLTRILDTFKKLADPSLRAVVWTDREIREGEEWKAKITEALHGSMAALMIVSEHFHASTFIREFELPKLMDSHDRHRAVVMWIRLDQVDYRVATYGKLQAAIHPDPPLKEQSPEDQDRRLAELVGKMILLLKGQRTKPLSDSHTRQRRNGLWACGMIVASLLLMWASHLISAWRPETTDVLKLVHGETWIGYEPTSYRPDRKNDIADTEIERELLLLKRAGISGIVTFTSRDDLKQVAQLAHDQGLAVIMGVWNPLDFKELRNAYEQRKFVAGYCVGHNCLSDDSGQSVCTERDLETAIRWLRLHTHLPVTTTQLGKSYNTQSIRLNAMGDFLCPDLHHNFRYSDVKQDVALTTAEIARISLIARQYNRPLLLKTLTYPTRMSAEDQPDYEQQADYYTQVLLAVRDPLTGPEIPVSFVLHSAFDSPWKQGGTFLPWDAFTGVFDSNGQPRPVVRQWMRLKP